MNQEKIGSFIAEKRKEVGLTQKDFAEKLGVTDKTVSRWENGHYLPDISLFKDICEILNIEITELLNGQTQNNNDKKEVEKAIMNIINVSGKDKKKNVRKVICISVTVITLLVVLFGAIYINRRNKINKLQNELNLYNKEVSKDLRFPFRSAILEKENGWVCSLDIEYIDSKPYYYGYNCDNFKYQYIKGFNQEVQGDVGHESFYKDINIFGTPSYFYNNEYRKDIDAINDYLLEKKYDKEISLEDLKDLSINKISKDDVVYLYNKAISSELVTKYGNYDKIVAKYLNTSDVLKSDKWFNKERSYSFVLGYLSNGGHIYYVNIDLLIDDEYLSDVVDSGGATKEQKEVYELLLKIEKNIVEKQSFRDYLEDVPYNSILAPLQQNVYYVETDNADELSIPYGYAWGE